MRCRNAAQSLAELLKHTQLSAEVWAGAGGGISSWAPVAALRSAMSSYYAFRGSALGLTARELALPATCRAFRMVVLLPHATLQLLRTASGSAKSVGLHCVRAQNQIDQQSGPLQAWLGSRRQHAGESYFASRISLMHPPDRHALARAKHAAVMACCAERCVLVETHLPHTAAELLQSISPRR